MHLATMRNTCLVWCEDRTCKTIYSTLSLFPAMQRTLYRLQQYRNNSTQGPSNEALRRKDSDSPNANTSTMSATSSLPCSSLTSTVSNILPSKQATHAFLTSLFELLLDLLLSFIGYFALATLLDELLRQLALAFFWPGWTYEQKVRFVEWKISVAWSMLYSLWAARFVLRWRGHLCCVGRYLARILHWLSPLSPKLYEACPCCSNVLTRSGGEQTRKVTRV